VILKGFDARRAGAYRWRQGDPARDLDLYGSPVPSNNIVIVRLDKCRIWDCGDTKCGRSDGQHQHFSAQDAPQAVPLAYAGTWYGFAEWQYENTNGWFQRVLFVKDGTVYKARLHKDEPPESAKIRLFGKGILVGKDRILQ
jgi:hypothetical protein